MSRGNSLVAGVVLIGLLSALAVALQSANPQVASDAQVAGAKFAVDPSGAPSKTVAPAKTTADKGDQELTPCTDGYNYRAVTEDGNTTAYCQQEMDCGVKSTTATKAAGGKSSSKQCTADPKFKDTPYKRDADRCQKWECKTQVCTKKGDTEVCVNTKSRKALEGELIDTKKLKEEAAPELLKKYLDPSTSDADKAAIKSAQQASVGLQEGFNKAFAEKEANLAQQVDDQNASMGKAAQDVKTAEERLAQCALMSADCTKEQSQYEDAKAKLDADNKRLEELKAQQKRLADARVELKPGTPPAREKTEAEKIEERYRARLKEIDDDYRRKMAEIDNKYRDPNAGKGDPGQGAGPKGGQPPQNTFPPQQQQQNQQCSWFQALFSSCPQLECKFDPPTQNAQPGQPVTLRWQTTGGTAQYASITNLGTVPPNGQAQVNPQMTTIYSMRVQGQATQQGQSGQTADCQTTVTVGTQNQPTQPGALSLTFSAVPSSIALGETAKLKWSSPASTCTASEGWNGTKPPSGEESVSPLKTTTYSIMCQGNLGSATRQVTITVGGGTSPTSGAEISCSPKIADVGMKVAITYSCKNSVKSTGVGFSTNDQTSGSAEVTIEKPPAGTDTVSYGLTCVAGDGREVNASPVCKVQINKPSLIFVANPKTIDDADEKPDTTTLGWITKGMKSCVISSPDDSAFTEANKNKKNVSGSLKTGALDEDTEFVLTCITLADQEKTTKVEVDVI